MESTGGRSGGPEKAKPGGLRSQIQSRMERHTRLRVAGTGQLAFTAQSWCVGNEVTLWSLLQCSGRASEGSERKCLWQFKGMLSEKHKNNRRHLS